MIRIKNTAEDRSKSLLHRTASKFEIEPMLGDQRIRLRSHLDITEEYYERVKHLVAPWIAAGMVEVINLDTQQTIVPALALDVPKEGPSEVIEPPVEAPVAAPVEQFDMIDDTPPVEETFAVTPEPEPVLAPVVEEVPAPAPAVAEKPVETHKKGSGYKKKLF